MVAHAALVRQLLQPARGTMNEKNSVRQRGSLGVILVMMLCGGMFCMTRPAEVPSPGINTLDRPPEKLSPECQARLEAQQELARLAVDAMRTYGRIDPGLFETTPAPGDRQLIRVSANARPLEPSAAVAKEDNALGRFNERLAKLNDGPSGALAAKLFSKAHAAAREKCGDQCPPTVYPIKVESLQRDEPESEAYSFQVQGDELPSLVEWQEGFLAQYASAQSECKFAPSIALEGLGHKSQDKAALASARQSFAQLGQTAGVRGGLAEALARCDADGHAQCGACLTTSNHDGKYKQTILGSCCYSQC
jgi:hypothetical protein